MIEWLKGLFKEKITIDQFKAYMETPYERIYKLEHRVFVLENMDGLKDTHGFTEKVVITSRETAKANAKKEARNAKRRKQRAETKQQKELAKSAHNNALKKELLSYPREQRETIWKAKRRK